MSQLYTANSTIISYMGFNPFKMWSSYFRLHHFPILMVQMLFFPYSAGPWPQLPKGRKIPEERKNSRERTSDLQVKLWEHSGSVIECLSRDRGVAGSSLTGVTSLWSLGKTDLSYLSTGSTQEDPYLFN